MPVMTTVATLTCQQVLCNASAVADTFMGFAWKMYSVLCSNIPKYQYPNLNATAEQCGIFARAEIPSNARAGCESGLVGSLLEVVTYTNEGDERTTKTALGLQFS